MDKDTERISVDDVEDLEDARKLAKKKIVYQRYFIPVVVMAAMAIMAIYLMSH